MAAAGLVHPERGLSLRFPRFVRKRPDKGLAGASTPEFLAGLYRKQTTALHTHFFGALESLGFAIAHVEFNIACGFTCVEFLWVNRRLFSPRRDSR